MGITVSGDGAHMFETVSIDRNQQRNPNHQSIFFILIQALIVLKTESQRIKFVQMLG
jgi:hypothetical protein